MGQKKKSAEWLEGEGDKHISSRKQKVSLSEYCREDGLNKYTVKMGSEGGGLPQAQPTKEVAFSGVAIYGIRSFPGSSVVKNPPANVGDASLIPGSRRFPWRRKW